MRAGKFKASIVIVLLAVLIAACATYEKSEDGIKAESKWAANVYLGALRMSEPEIIGLFRIKSGCERAVKEWLQSQVVGQAISGECLPIDFD